MDNKHESVGYYLDPYRWVAETPFVDNANNIDGSRVQDLVYIQQFASKYCDFNLSVYRDGLFQFDFQSVDFEGIKLSYPIDFGSDFNLRQAVIKILNVHLLFLYLANMSLDNTNKLRLKNITLRPSDLWFIDNSVAGVFRSSSGVNVAVGLFMARGNAEKRVYSIDTMQIDSQLALFLTRNVSAISIKVLEKSSEWLSKLFSHPDFERLIVLWDLYTKALQSSFNFDTALALVTSWVIIETLLSDWLARLVASKKLIRVAQTTKMVTFQNQYGKRKKYNTDKFGTLTSYNYIEVLKWIGELPHPQPQVLHDIRKTRNDWVHSLKSPSEIHIDNARMAIFDLIRHIYQFRCD